MNELDGNPTDVELDLTPTGKPGLYRSNEDFMETRRAVDGDNFAVGGQHLLGDAVYHRTLQVFANEGGDTLVQITSGACSTGWPRPSPTLRKGSRTATTYSTAGR